MQRKNIAIIGGGPAGIEAAASLAQLGYHAIVIEKDSRLGGHLNLMYNLFPDKRPADEVLCELLSHIENENIETHVNTEIVDCHKEGDAFILKTNKGDELTASAILMATGFKLFDASRKEEYGYGIYPGVINSFELEAMLKENSLKAPLGATPKRVIMLHCVGSRDEKVGNHYCSKVCCVTAVKQAIEIKRRHPETEVFCFYMDIRMFGPYYEELYREAQEKWKVTFIRGKISEAAANIDGEIQIKAEDTLIGKPLRMKTDLLVLMCGMEAHTDNKLSSLLNIEQGENRFFKSTDNYLLYNNTNVDGVFTAGACTAPMNIIDTIANARASAFSIHQYLTASPINSPYKI